MNNIKTIGDLKRAIAKFQEDANVSDDYPVLVPVHTETKAYAIEQPRVSFVSGGYGALCINIWMSPGTYITQRGAQRGK